MNLKNVLRSKRASLRGLIAYAGLVAAAFALQLYVRDFRAPGTAFVPEPPKFLALSLDPRIIRRFLGVRILAADLVWIDTLIKSDIEREKKDFTTMYQAARVMTALDPDNYFAYYVLGLYLSVIKDDIKGATAFLRDGAQSL
ncbi:MAG: hypothetical protein HYW49_13985, partial [Deltaproteobacteria bacterium]|nr:hypothetical protein [Deltaproteobacteria bacterium]